ncbi:MAG: hypothetical protein ACR2GX_05480 [Candidatus Dormibacteria bacterium]|uniref:Uncharacterized protein n=1 Tax=Candidatus Aeolococcus gillhamiae TaxID=3127015 RepID=A0A2W5ZBA3_9BACT|nr:MAG: hypothetical protein DLM65_03345 [Candidatus Dormibacter sp. RRmetagenome_bin12]
MNEPLLDLFGFLGGTVAVLVDRRRAVLLASAAVAVGLMPSAVGFGGSPAAFVLAGSVVVGAALGGVARLAGTRTHAGGGIDPLVPVYAPRRELFGPRSLRLVAAALSLPAASWISYNVPVGLIVPIRGMLFPVAFLWICGALRILLARTIEDLAVGTAVIGLAAAVGWLARGGVQPILGAVLMASLVPLASMVAEFLGGRRAASVRAPAASQPTEGVA